MALATFKKKLGLQGNAHFLKLYFNEVSLK